MKHICYLPIGLLFVACQNMRPQEYLHAEPDATEKLHALFEKDWEWLMEQHPELATDTGYRGQNHRWTDHSLEAIAQRKQHTHESLAELQAIDRNALGKEDLLNYDLYLRELQMDIEGDKYATEYMPINQRSGVQIRAAGNIAIMPHTTVKEYQDILSRLGGLATWIEQTKMLLEKGLAMGATPPKITLDDVPQQILNQIPDDALQSPLLESFTKFPDSIAQAEQEALTAKAKSIYQEKIVPAFTKLHEYLTTTYIPNCRESIAAKDLPWGKNFYAYRVRRFTTTSMTPEEIHQLGLSEVKRIRAEMEKVIAQTDFTGSFVEFCEFLRTDKQFFFADEDDLLQAYRDICKRADPELAKLFGKLPRLPYGVKAVPAYSEKSQTTAYYESGVLDTGRPGYFFANTYNLNSRPKWEMEALSLHEAVPGHHLQIAIAQELNDLPNFRRFGGYTAFVEGWGLYSESLGEEMGFYQDPYAKFGQLTYEMWRAIRLVVDTGMHDLGWSREQAIDFFLVNTAKTRHDIEVEVDRYIVWPGQALAYKIGELKLKELRKYAETRLGELFNVRAFHDVVLGQGALPLNILEQRVKDWVAGISS